MEALRTKCYALYELMPNRRRSFFVRHALAGVSSPEVLDGACFRERYGARRRPYNSMLRFGPVVSAIPLTRIDKAASPLFQVEEAAWEVDQPVKWEEAPVRSGSS